MKMVIVWLASALFVPTVWTQSKVPPSFAALLPTGAVLKSGNWAVMDTTMGGDLNAGFSKPRLCQQTSGSEVRISVKGDTTWEGPILDMAVQNQTDEARKSKASLTKHSTSLVTLGTVKLGAGVKEETLPNGRVIYYDYTESCSSAPTLNVAVLDGYGRKGSFFVDFRMTITTGLADAKAAANEILTKFQNFDPAKAK